MKNSYFDHFSLKKSICHIFGSLIALLGHKIFVIDIWDICHIRGSVMYKRESTMCILHWARLGPAGLLRRRLAIRGIKEAVAQLKESV